MRKLLTEEDKARIRASELRLAQLAESVKATQDANKVHDDSVYGSKEIVLPVGEIRKAKGKESYCIPPAPKPVLRDTRGIRVRTMAGKLPRHGERPTLSNAIRTQSDGTTQVIVYDPSRDYVDMHGAFVALRDRDVKALPPKLRRAYERAKHRASVANNVKPE